MTTETERLKDLVNNCTADKMQVVSDDEGECWFLAVPHGEGLRAKYELIGKLNHYDLRLFAMAPELAAEVIGLRYVLDRYREQYGSL